MLVGSFAAFAVIVAGQNLWQRFDAYTIRYNNTSVSGLQEGSTVIYQGLDVGSIETIEIDPQNVETIVVTIQIQDGTPIKADVVARIVPVGITGISQIELSGGTQDAPLREPGSVIPAADSTVTQVTDSVQNVLTNLERVLADIAGVLNRIDPESIGNILSDIELVITDNQAAVTGLITELEQTTAEFASAAGRIDGLVESAASVTEDVEFIVRRNTPEINEAVEQLNDTLRLLNNFAFQINSDPSLLIVPEENR